MSRHDQTSQPDTASHVKLGWEGMRTGFSCSIRFAGFQKVFQLTMQFRCGKARPPICLIKALLLSSYSGLCICASVNREQAMFAGAAESNTPRLPIRIAAT